MKVVQIDNYSKTIDSVKIREISIPEIKPDEVLVKVKFFFDLFFISRHLLFLLNTSFLLQF